MSKQPTVVEQIKTIVNEINVYDQIYDAVKNAGHVPNPSLIMAASEAVVAGQTAATNDHIDEVYHLISNPAK